MSTAEPPPHTVDAEIDIPARFARMESRRPPTPTEASLRELAKHDPSMKTILDQYELRVLTNTARADLTEWLITAITSLNTSRDDPSA